MSAMAGGGGIYNNPTSLIDSPDGGPVSGTENPLWIDQKYKTYEEQELTMTIFSDQVSLVNRYSQCLVISIQYLIDTMKRTYFLLSQIKLVVDLKSEKMGLF